MSSSGQKWADDDDDDDDELGVAFFYSTVYFVLRMARIEISIRIRHRLINVSESALPPQSDKKLNLNTQGNKNKRK